MPYSLPVTCISLSGIAGTDCIGDTRTFINDNFTKIGQELCNLFSNTITLSTTSTVQHTFTSSSRLLASDVRNNSIDTRHLIDNSVTTAKISAEAVTTDKIALSAVTTQTIANSAVTAEKINLVTSLNSNGYQIMPGGLIMQWGTVSSPGGSISVNTAFNFPTAFPVSALSLVALGELATNDRLSYTNLTNTGATFQVADTNGSTVQAATIKYIALGY
jgi:hypothetical protein